MRTRSSPRSLLAVTVIGALALAGRSSMAQFDAPRPVITPVAGPSNFHRLGIDFETSAMGRTGLWGPPPQRSTPPPPGLGLMVPVGNRVTLSGADIYRLSCQACHRADGQGSPPEIPSVAGPVQAMSAAMMMARMKAIGRPISPAFARELTAGSKTDLLNRLRNGGEKMPSFAHLDKPEVDALIAYLGVLAGVPGSHDRARVVESPLRQGELLIKGTCHICHDATGRWPTPEQLLEGDIPPIAGFTKKKPLPAFLWKVRHGAPVIMGPLSLPYRGRMPVFDYLSESDVTAAYLYLLHEPPGGNRPVIPLVVRSTP